MGSDSARFPQKASSSPGALVPFNPKHPLLSPCVGATCASASGGVFLPPSPCRPFHPGTRTVTDPHPRQAGIACTHPSKKSSEAKLPGQLIRILHSVTGKGLSLRLPVIIIFLIFIWLHQVLAVGTWDLLSSLWYVGYLAAACGI